MAIFASLFTGMKLITTIPAALEHARSLTEKQLTTGFVPTMGALHEGHLSLVRKARTENDRIAVSIFVNPIQFNNPADLEKYPRNLNADLRLLDPLLRDDDYVFAPSEQEMYPEANQQVYDFGSLATVMEGRFRPGHFNGVGVVVNKLLRIVHPDRAYFGEKDFQQLAIIRRLVEIEKLNVDIIACPIIREKDGLAMSSRNQRLTPEHRRIAPLIHRTLLEAIEKSKSYGVDEVRRFICQTLEYTGLLVPEYVEFADETTLSPINGWSDSPRIRCFIAVHAGDVRLIDTIPFSGKR